MRRKLLLLAISMELVSCVSPVAQREPAALPTSKYDRSCKEFAKLKPDVLKQRDEIYMLLAYAAVAKGFQSDRQNTLRGHNIAAILVDPEGHPVWWERNANHVTCNGTQHAEARTMISYLEAQRSYNLRCHTLYTTLEPCAMCGGMMTMQRLLRTVYGMTDPHFGKALERLQGYPWAPSSEISSHHTRGEFDKTFSDSKGRSITRFLYTNTAKEIFKNAEKEFLNYTATSDLLPENQDVYREAVQFYHSKVTSFYMTLDQHVLSAKDPRHQVESKVYSRCGSTAAADEN